VARRLRRGAAGAVVAAAAALLISVPLPAAAMGTAEPDLAGISLDQTASPLSYDAAGQTISYSFVVTDSGDTALTNVSIDDTDLPGLSAINCPQSSLAPEDSETCTATYVTTEADVDNGDLVNQASAQGDPPASGPIYSPGTTVTVSVVQTPGISLDLSAAPSTYDAPGQTITYSYAVTNTGNVTLAGITANDGLPGLSAISCPQPSLAPGGSETCTATYVSTQADVDNGFLFNEATAQGDAPGGPCSRVRPDAGVDGCGSEPVVSDPSDAYASAAQTPGISLVKSASPSSYDAPGQTITYSFAVTNTGNVSLAGITVNDTDLPGLSAISCPQPSLAPGGSETCTATYVTTQADVDNGDVFNEATAQGDTPGGSCSRVGDPGAGRDGCGSEPVVSAPSDATVFAAESPAISLVKSASPSNFSKPGQTITYSFDVTNTGNSILSGITVNDTDLPGLSAISCPQPSLAPGGAETCTATYVTTQADLDAGALFNTATAQGDPPTGQDAAPLGKGTPPVVSDPSSATVPAVQSPAISLVKSASPASFSKPGQTITYSFDVTNTGNVTLSGIAVNDKDLPGLSKVSCPVSTLAPARTETCTATYVTTKADLEAGAVSNTATAQGLSPESSAPMVSKASSVTVAVIPAPGIAMAVSASPPSFTTAGQEITYSYLVTNTGNVRLTSVSITDPLPGLSAIVCPSSRLAVGAHETCTATYVITSADVAAGTVTNEATVQAQGMRAGAVSLSRASSIIVQVPAPIVPVPVPVTG
jgi:uncharacterized repeat protein (TIGR01451 family)